jgi:hypothetical protein
MMRAESTDYAGLSVGLSSGSVHPKGVRNAYGSQTICCARCVVIQGFSQPSVYSRSQTIVAQALVCPVHHPRPTLQTYPKE